jgi:RNA polymerase sigma-70 factor (ECF subfamily)
MASADNAPFWLAGRADAPTASASSALSLEAVYRAHAPAVIGWAARLLGPDGDPDDVAHEVFLVVHRRLGEFRGDARITTWLHEITVRVALAHRRRARRWRWLKADRAGEAPSWLSGFGFGADESEDPLRLIERRRDTERLYAILGRLGETYRTALILYHLEALPVPEIARLLGTSESNVWARLSRGRAKFAARCAAEEHKAR